jgi:hypothetical protein
LSFSTFGLAGKKSLTLVRGGRGENVAMFLQGQWPAPLNSAFNKVDATDRPSAGR